MKVRYTDTALGEINETCAYIASDNPEAAADVADAIEQAIALIAARPKAAPVVYVGDVRARLVRRFQLRIFYIIHGRDLIIRNVRRTQRLRPWEGKGS
jgi:plasmid stabilization system protein ParE